MEKIKKDDNVEILLGKDRGKTGKVERVLGKEQRVFISGLNLYKRHVKGRGQTEGGIIDLIKPMNLSNVAIVCPKCKKATRVGFKITDTGKSRICRRCGEAL